MATTVFKSRSHGIAAITTGYESFAVKCADMLLAVPETAETAGRCFPSSFECEPPKIGSFFSNAHVEKNTIAIAGRGPI